MTPTTKAAARAASAKKAAGTEAGVRNSGTAPAAVRSLSGQRGIARGGAGEHARSAGAVAGAPVKGAAKGCCAALVSGGGQASGVGGADVRASGGGRPSERATAGLAKAAPRAGKGAPRSAEIGRMFRAFSDHTRLRILNLLLDGELCVCDLVGVLAMSQPKVSRHLAYLRRAGLVLARRDGLWMHYRLTEPAAGFHTSLLNCLQGCFADVPELAADRGALDQRRCSPEGNCHPE